MNEVPLIPRTVFFGNPDRASVQLSPDGSRIAFLAPLDGVLNVWVALRGLPGAARPVTHDTGSGIRIFMWTYRPDELIYLQDEAGDENWRLYAVNVADGLVRNLTPFDGVQARLQGISPDHPDSLLVALNRRDPQLHDLYRLDLVSGELTLLAESEGFLGWLTDDAYRVRAALRPTPDGGMEIVRPSLRAAEGPAQGAGDAVGGWSVWQAIPPEDVLTTHPFGFDKSGEVLYMADSRGRNTSAAMVVDMATGDSRLLAADPQADVEGGLMHPRDRRIQALSFVYERKRWQILDPAIEVDLAYLATVADGEVEIASRTLDDAHWIVSYLVDDGPARFYLYDRLLGAASFLFTNRSALEGLPLARMHSVLIRARDGQELVAYLTLPLRLEEEPYGSDSGVPMPRERVPLVLTPHGGPWGRDRWGYNGWHQWLANRGYAVLSVNFRASTGLGKAFVNAGDQQWAGTIIEDQADAVRWAIDEGIADPNRVAVMGGSFGGYSTLAGLTFTPELFACGVDLFGPANLITLLETIPPYWKPQLELMAKRIGDPRTEEGRELLRAHSPLTYAGRIVRPLLIGQGANDARVKQAESDQIVAALKEKGIPVTYVLYPDEGHGFRRPENTLSFNAITEAFLAQHLGGRCEPIGDDFQGASLQVVEGRIADFADSALPPSRPRGGGMGRGALRS
ncbi:MAG: S9 family peptidase [Anaerolineae bacterium]|nr:S9 family peptidase [Anaerolineae bacterium]